MATKYIRFLSAEEASDLPDGQAVMVAVAVDEDGAPVDLGGEAYVLPAATTGALGGVKQAAHVDGSSGTVQNIVDALVASGAMASA